MNIEMLVAVSPQLIIAFGVVLSMLLIAWKRTQHLIYFLTQAIILFALILTIKLLFEDSVQATILLKVDGFGLFANIVLLISGLVIVEFSRQILSKSYEFHDEFYLLIQLVVLGASLLVICDHFASLFLGFELLSIALVGLVGYFNEQKRAIETSFKYLILSASASSFMLLGIAFIYSQTGQLTFDLATSATTLGSLYNMGVLLLFVGMAFKLSLVPFHMWTPDVYQGASLPITMLMATVSKLAMFTVLIKCWFAQQYFANELIMQVVTAVAVLSMIFGNVLALYQQNMKRLLAYSSIAHMGYMLIVLIVTTRQSQSFAWHSALFYLSAYVLATLSIFTALFYLNESSSDNAQRPLDDNTTINDLTGLFWSNPVLALLVIVSVLSLAGIPLTMGFIGKFYLLNHATQMEQWTLITALIVGSSIALFYYLRIIFTLFNDDKTEQIQNQAQIGGYRLAFMAKAIVISFSASGIVFGVFPNVISQFIARL